MNAQKMAMFILCFVLMGGIVNGLEIFESVSVPNVTMPSADLAEGITEVGDGDVTTSSDLSDVFDGWAMLKSMIGAIATMFGVLTVPGYYLYSVGMPLAMAGAIQTIVTCAEIYGLIQFISNRSLKGME